MYRKLLLIFASMLFILCFTNGCAFSKNLPQFKITFKVIDAETNEPIQNVEAAIILKIGGWDPQYTKLTGKTDKDGKCTFAGRSTRWVKYGVGVDGYYSVGNTYKFQEFESYNPAKHKPWDPEVIIKLKKIKNPIPMYTADVSFPVPKLGEEIGFDLIEADWVAPYGSGKVSDFIFKMTKEYKNIDDYNGELTLTFSNQFDGIYPFPADQNSDSQLILPYLAPLDGYLINLSKYEYTDPVKREGFTNMDKEQHYFFRIRTEVKDGKLEKAMYGKIHGDLRFGGIYHIRKLDQGKPPVILFRYFLNPDGTRNTEYKPDSNLFTYPDTESSAGVFRKVNQVK